MVDTECAWYGVFLAFFSWWLRLAPVSEPLQSFGIFVAIADLVLLTLVWMRL